VTTDEPQAPDAAEAKPEQRPLLKVIRGDASPEEVAALVAVVAALGSAPGEPAPRRTPEWSAHHRKTRVSLPHGPGGWRSSALPR